MSEKYALKSMQFIISTIAYLIIFIAVCASVGFSDNIIMLFNGIFFIIYILSLWKTGMDTFEFYDSQYFVVDMLSVATYANIPRIFISWKSLKYFICLSLVLIGLNESICVVWDILCHKNSVGEEGKGFHLKWTIFTFLGIIGILVSIITICFIEISDNIIYLLDVCNILYQFLLLISWWVSEYCILKKHNST